MKAPPLSPPGRASEDALCELLAGNGYGVVTMAEWLRTCEDGAPTDCAVSEYVWGLRVGRRFRSDVAFPMHRLLVEIEGQVHAIKGKRKGDIVREQLATGLGYRVLRVLPEQVHNGEALALVAKAMGE